MTATFNKKNYKLYIYSFLVAFLGVLIGYALNGIFPFGNKSVLTADIRDQYIGIIIVFFEHLKNGDNIFLTWKSALGSNLYAAAVYIMANPLSILFAFFDIKYYQEIYFIIIVIKIAFIGMSFSIYAANSNILKLKTARLNIAMSVCYALAVTSLKATLNPMWLENIALLPLAFLSVEKIIEDKKPVLFLISITWCFITNYYLSYMTVIFLIIYFIYYLVLFNKGKKVFLEAFFMLFIYGMLAVGISMPIIYPSFLAVSDTYTDVLGVGFNGDFVKYSFKDIAFFFIYSVSERSTSGYPCAFSSIFVIWMCMGYFINKAVPKKNKIISALIMLFFILSLHINGLYFMWHLFRAPTGFDGRFLYGVVLFMLIFAGVNLKNFHEGINIKHFALLGFLLLCVAVYSVLERINVYYIACIALILVMLIIYGVLLVKNSKCMLMAVIVLEMLVSAYNGFRIINLWDGYADRNEYISYVTDYREKFKELYKYDDSFYRSDCNKIGFYNSALMVGYNSLAQYSSLANQKTIDVMRKMGATSIEDNKVLTVLGQNKVLDSIFGVKYYGAINKNEPMVDNLGRKYYYNGIRITNSNYIPVFENADSIFYENKNAFPLMLGVDEKFKNCRLDSQSYFENQNEFLNLMLDNNLQLYEKLDINNATAFNCQVNVGENGLAEVKPVNLSENKIKAETEKEVGIVKLEYTAEKSGNYFTVLNGEFENNAIVNKQCAYSINDTPMTLLKMDNELKDLGWYEKGDVITICYYSFVDTNIYFPVLYRLNEEAFNDFSLQANENALGNIKNFKGNISACSDFDKETLVFSSISYDEGFNVYIDNQKAEKLCLAGGFLGYYVPAGEHSVEISYTSPGFIPGAVIGCISLFIGCFMLFVDEKLKKKGLKMKKLNNEGFSFIAIIISVAIMVVLVSMNMNGIASIGGGKASNVAEAEVYTEMKTVATVVYNSGKTYITTKNAQGVQLEANGLVPVSDVITGVDTSKYKTVEVRLNENGDGIKYVYLETNDGLSYDYPVGSSGKVE